MIENYVNSLEAILLYVYADGQRVSADSTPTATAIDIETGGPVSLGSVSTTTHNDGYDYYSVSLDPSEVTETKQVLVTWNYVYQTQSFIRTEVVSVIRPYFQADAFWSRFPEFAPDGTDPRTIDEVQEVEQLVRMRINQYCKQEFQNFGLKSKRVRGSGTNALQLPERIYRLESVKSGELTLFDRDVNGDVTIDTAVWYEEEPYLITKKSVGTETVTFSDRDPVVSSIERTRSLFRSDRLYEVEAKYGWEYLPQEVQQAALLLAYDELQAEDRYRKRNITVVRSADYRLEFGADHHTTTGNVDADTILTNYVHDGVFVF